jgi:hypothetical protein
MWNQRRMLELLVANFCHHTGKNWHGGNCLTRLNCDNLPHRAVMVMGLCCIGPMKMALDEYLSYWSGSYLQRVLQHPSFLTNHCENSEKSRHAAITDAWHFGFAQFFSILALLAEFTCRISQA